MPQVPPKRMNGLFSGPLSSTLASALDGELCDPSWLGQVMSARTGCTSSEAGTPHSGARLTRDESTMHARTGTTRSVHGKCWQVARRTAEAETVWTDVAQSVTQQTQLKQKSGRRHRVQFADYAATASAPLATACMARMMYQDAQAARLDTQVQAQRMRLTWLVSSLRTGLRAGPLTARTAQAYSVLNGAPSVSSASADLD